MAALINPGPGGLLRVLVFIKYKTNRNNYHEHRELYAQRQVDGQQLCCGLLFKFRQKCMLSPFFLLEILFQKINHEKKCLERW